MFVVRSVLPLNHVFAVLSLISMSSFTAIYAQPENSDKGRTGRPTYRAPEWLSDAATASDFKETQFLPIDTKPFSEYINPITSTTIVGVQPSGYLSGKILYAMAGHGWTYDANRMTYLTQRGLGHGMIEDLGNADQMHIFAHLAFNAGATIVPLRPVDHQINERVLDNTMPQVSFYGDWFKGTNHRYYGDENDEVRYGFARASREESAVVRFTPYIPEEGLYPVYIWAGDGSDRSNQLYRVVHSGGVNEIHVNHRLTGKGWVWIGTYHFEKGMKGFTEVSNKALDPYDVDNNRVVVADAVRFGNGMGDTPRPGGITGFPREDEGDIYWIENSLGKQADRRLFSSISDSSATVASPPRTAGYLNRESEGSFFDRILISFHSNAANRIARGAVSLFNASPFQRPDFQELLAEFTGREINRRMAEFGKFADLDWKPRPRNTYNGINFGELRKDYLQNEMSATLVESAFHDNAEDARFLLNPDSRIKISIATLNGLLKWFNAVEQKNSVVTLPPAPPVKVFGKYNFETKQFDISWEKGPVTSLHGDEPLGYRIYTSRNGKGFDGGTLIERRNAFAFPAETSTTVYVRVTAINQSGQSLPSETIALSAFEKNNKTLLVAVPTILDDSLNDHVPIGLHPGSPYQEKAVVQRVRPLQFIFSTLLADEAKILTKMGVGFDSASMDVLTGNGVDMSAYSHVLIIAGNRNANTALLTDEVQQQLSSYVRSGGNLLFSGSQIASNLKDHAANFYQNFIGTKLSPETVASENVLKSVDVRFMDKDETLNIAVAAGESEIVDTFIAERPKSLPLIQFVDVSGEKRTAGIITRPYSGKGQAIFLSFPTSLIDSENNKMLLLQAVLKQLN